jgi:hypothetical protein
MKERCQEVSDLFFVRDGFDFMCVCSHFIMPILHISATGAPRKSLHLSGRSITLNYVPPLISSATAFTQSFYASASPPTKSLPPRRAYATSLYQIFFTFFYFKAPFFSKRRRLSSFSSLSSRVVFLFLFARNCDALPHTHTRTNRPCQLVTFPRTIWNRAEFQ